MIMRLRVLFLPAMAIGLRILPAVPSRREVLGAVAAISVYGLPPAVVAEEGEMARQTLGLQTAYGTDPWASSAPPEKLLASYDKMLLQRAREELGSSSGRRGRRTRQQALTAGSRACRRRRRRDSSLVGRSSYEG